MKDAQSARRFLVEALEQSNAFYLRDGMLAESFVAGTTDVPIATLEMDSLAEMELCIAIEVNTGISIVPEQLRDMEMLGDLARAIL